MLRKENRRPWWNKQCYAVIHGVRKAYREWRDSPLSAEKTEAWRRAEAVKRKRINKAKRTSWKSHLNNLGYNEDPSKLWNFVKGMLGRRTSSNPLDTIIMKDHDGREYHSASDKASLMLETFSKKFSTLIPNNENYEAVISSHIASTTPNVLNSAITIAKMDLSLKKLKDTTMGIDLIHNKMFKKLSPANRFYLCHLFNVLFHHTFVPNQWKRATLVPLLKTGQAAENPVSYRPVALTSCVGKLFERVMSSRLDWFVESYGVLPTSQAGFRRKRNTTDHIVQLELDVKEGFSQKESTVAVYLDICKAYDCVWIQGL